MTTDVDYELPASVELPETSGQRREAPLAPPATAPARTLRLRVHDVAIRVAKASPAGDLWATAEVAFTPSPDRPVREQMRELLEAVETELGDFLARGRSGPHHPAESAEIRRMP
ncbi:MAG TPA: hypothetical protein VFD01_08045 [Candidatus Dormibacteraeota bacterium]|jgi:hypothetical protein|nr:hypothetical protein [Candidatus Dormibacteraeota bacterium]